MILAMMAGMRLISLILACLLFIEPVMADPLPDTDSQGTLTDRADFRLGQQIMNDIRMDPTYVADPEITDYLNRIAQRLVAHSQAPWQHIQVFFLHDPEINAFALPGGFIGVNSALLQATDSESELASVLAHEIGHVVQHHYERSKSETSPWLASLATIALVIAAAKANNPNAMNAAVSSMTAGMVQRQLAFSREHEKEADRVGFQMLKDAGFDPHGMASFFEKLQKSTSLEDSGDVPAFLRTHPLTSERIADMHNRADKLPYKQYPTSMDYYLVKTKARASFGQPEDLVHFYQLATGDRSWGISSVQHYGLAVALKRAHRYADARKALAVAQKELKNPMLDSLAASIDLDAGKPHAALADCRAAVAKWPESSSLALECIQTDLTAGDVDAALKLANTRLGVSPDDPRLLSFKAQALEKKGDLTNSHIAQADAYVSEGNPSAAIEQLQIAQKTTRDFYTLSILDARLRDLRAQAQAIKALDKDNQ